MKIALLGPAVTNHSVRWANGLSERGHQITLISQHALRGRLAPSVHFESLPVCNATGYVLNAGRLNRVLAAGGFDIVHAHYASGYGTLLRLLRHPRKILSIWGSDVTNFPHKSPLHRAVLKANLRAAGHLCVTSEHLARVTAELICVPANRLSIIPFGVDVQMFAPGARRDRSTRVIGSIKGLDRKYRMDRLVAVFSRLLEMHPDMRDQVTLRIYGEGTMRRELEHQIDRLGIDKQVELRGWIPHEEVPAALAQIDVAVFLSREEGFGVAALEAGAMEVPVVAAATGGLPEVVVDGETGILVDPNNRDHIATTLHDLLCDAGLRSTLGRNGRRWVTARYDWEKSLDAMNAVYDRLYRPAGAMAGRPP